MLIVVGFRRAVAACLLACLTPATLFAQSTLYVSNFGGGGSVSTISPEGIVSTFTTDVGNGAGVVFDSNDNLFVSDYHVGSIVQVTPENVVSTFATGIEFPGKLLADASDNLYALTGQLAGGYAQITKITPDGQVSTFATSPAGFSAMAFDGAGNLFATSAGDNADVTKFAPDGTVFPDVYTDIGNYVSDMVFDDTGTLYYSHIYDAISRILPDGSINLFVYQEDLGGFGLALDSFRNLYISHNSPNKVSIVDPAGNVSLFATGGGLDDPNFMAFGPAPIPEPNASVVMVLCVGLLRHLAREKQP